MRRSEQVLWKSRSWLGAQEICRFLGQQPLSQHLQPNLWSLWGAKSSIFFTAYSFLTFIRIFSWHALLSRPEQKNVQNLWSLILVRFIHHCKNNFREILIDHFKKYNDHLIGWLKMILTNLPSFTLINSKITLILVQLSLILYVYNVKNVHGT